MLKKVVCTFLVVGVHHFCFGQFTGTTSIGASQEVWGSPAAWSFPAGFAPNEGYPVNDFDEDASTTAANGDFGRYLIIDTDDNIKIPNNGTIDLSNSSLLSLTMRAGSELHFGSNAKLKLPAGCTIYLETGTVGPPSKPGAKIISDNNSAGLLIEIGGNGVWGRACTGCNAADLTGPGYIDENSTPGDPLPIELFSFTGTTGTENVELNWITLSEINFDYFAIEHSTDGISFIEIEQIKGKGAGALRTSYKYSHENPAQAKNYYRLRSVDLDGSYAYSDVIMVLFQGEKRLTIFPNPTSVEHVQYQSNFEFTGNDQITLSNQLGGQVATGYLNSNSRTIEFSSAIQPGVYFLRYTGQEFSTVMRVILK